MAAVICFLITQASVWLFLSFLVSLSLSMSHEHAAVKTSSFKHSILIFHPILCLQCQCSTILCEAQDVLGQAGTLSQALLPLTSFLSTWLERWSLSHWLYKHICSWQGTQPRHLITCDLQLQRKSLFDSRIYCMYVYWWDRLDHVGSKREDGFHKSWLVGQQAWCNWRAAWNLVACCGDKLICCLEPNPRDTNPKTASVIRTVSVTF